MIKYYYYYKKKKSTNYTNIKDNQNKRNDLGNKNEGGIYDY